MIFWECGSLSKNFALVVVAQNHETFGILRFRAETVVSGCEIFGPAVAGRASKVAMTRSRRVEIGRNMDHRIRAYELFDFVQPLGLSEIVGRASAEVGRHLPSYKTKKRHPGAQTSVGTGSRHFPPQAWPSRRAGHRTWTGR